jgi:hypothetical protein
MPGVDVWQVCSPFLFFVFGTRLSTQGVVVAMQVLYHSSPHPCAVIFLFLLLLLPVRAPGA